MVGDVGMADRAEVYGVERAEQVQRILRHHAAVREIIFRPPVEIQEGAGEVVFLSGAFEDPLAFGNYFLAHAVSGDCCNV